MRLYIMNDSNNTKINFWGTLSRYFKGYEKNIVISVIFSLITGIMVAVQPLMIKYIVDDGILADVHIKKKLTIVAVLCFLYALISFLRVSMFGIAAHSMYKLMEGTLSNLRDAFFSSVQRLSMSFYDQTASGELFNCIMGSPMNNIKTYLSNVVISVPYQCISFAISFFALLSYDWLLTLILVFIAFVMMLLNNLSKKKVKRIARDYIATESQASKYINDMLHGLEATKMYSVEKDTIEKFQKYTVSMKEKGVEMSTSIWFEHAKPEVVQYFGTAVVYFVGALLCIYRGLSTGVLFAFISSMGIILSTISSILQIVLSQNSAAAGLEKIQNIIDYKSETPEVEDSRQRNVDIERASNTSKGNPCIEFKNVCFGYDDKKIYENFDCKINYNESIGLVGGSGSGKSTFTKLVMRLYDVNGGEVDLHGRNIKDFKLHDMRQCFGVVPQNPFMFQCSIMENVRIARPEATNSEVIEAMEMAHVHEFVNDLPLGWNTVIGDGGLNLSGGQKQRIAIARAILCNPDILIFDEATSALDNVSEKLIQKSMEELMKTHTVLIVAHRLTTIRNVDRILVFKDGKIVEEGKFDELVEKNGAFKELLTFKD